MTKPNDRRRRRARHYLVDADRPAELSTAVRLTATSLDFPRGQMNILDDVEQHTIADYHAAAPPLARERTICRFVVDTSAPLAVTDASKDPRFADLDVVRDGVVGSYIGVPVRGRESDVIGSLCVFDPAPRTITDDQVSRLVDFASVIETQLDVLRRWSEDRTPDTTETRALVAALRDGEIRPWYQPVVDLASGRLTAYEALARWTQDGVVHDPTNFVRCAEDSDVVVDLDLAMLRQSLRDLTQWLAVRPDLVLNVNVSTLHLEVDGGVRAIDELVRAAGVPPTSICIELTETRPVAEADVARTAVTDLRALGYSVLLDDFGSGWSSLDWMLQLPVTGIKIDRSVGSRLGGTVGDAVVRAVVGMARELDLVTTIEGLSSPDQVATARALGCRYGQGFYWSPPVPPAELAERRD